MSVSGMRGERVPTLMHLEEGNEVTGLKKRPSTVQLELSYRGQPFHELEQKVRNMSSLAPEPFTARFVLSRAPLVIHTHTPTHPHTHPHTHTHTHAHTLTHTHTHNTHMFVLYIHIHTCRCGTKNSRHMRRKSGGVWRKSTSSSSRSRSVP